MGIRPPPGGDSAPSADTPARRCSRAISLGPHFVPSRGKGGDGSLDTRVWIITLVAALAIAQPFAAAAAPSPLLRAEVSSADAGLTARCSSDVTRCELGDGARGSCGFEVEACVERNGLARLRVRGTRSLASSLVTGVRALPGAAPRPHGARFAPPLAAGCFALATTRIAVGSAARLVLVGRAKSGPRTRARIDVACVPSAPPPNEPPPPNPPPPPPPPGPPALLRFRRAIIDQTGGNQLTSDVGAGDLDGDGRPDVVASGFERILWYRNPDWTPSVIAEGAYGRGGKTLVRDMDGDGRLDIVTGAFDPAHEMIWFGNTPTGWQRHLLTDQGYCHDLIFGDLDGDGREEGVCVDQGRGQVLELVPPADPLAAWTVQTIDPDENAMGSAIGDVDGDGRPDVVIGRAWYRNEGAGAWTRREYTDFTLDELTGFRDYAKVSLLDLDGDGRLDIFATLYAETPLGSVFAFLAPADPLNQPWTAVPIDPGPLFGVHSQAVAAFDGTSRRQIMVGETGIGGFNFGVNPSPQIYIYRLLGSAADPAAWERTTIDTVGTHEARAVDLDGDGLPDLIGHEENTDVIGRDGAVQSWLNQTAR